MSYAGHATGQLYCVCFILLCFSTDPSPDFCTYRTFIDLGILNVNSSNIFTFDTTNRPVYGAWINPNSIKFVNNYHGFYVKMQIYNADRTNYQLIEKFYWPINESLNGVESGTADSSTGPNAGNFRTKVNLKWWTNNTAVNIPSTTPSLLRTTTTTPGGGGHSAEPTIAGITTEAGGSTDAPLTGTTTTAAGSGSTDIPPTGTTTTPGVTETAAGSGSTDTSQIGTSGTTDTLPTPTIADTIEASTNTEGM
uniref:Uncharacterized protein n=1 Tax=Acrobeloides nanus TaxID=290746 RepID=A0A914BZF2_9BILA